MTSGKSVLVIGDVMVDEYFTGIVSRISPEASVPILDVKSITDFPGGAANVAVNVNAAGFKPVVLSVIGNDREGRILLDLFDKYGIDKDGLIISETRKTTVKQRFISNNRQIFRADIEDVSNISADEENRIIEKTASWLETKDISIVILQDYNKGVLTANVIERVIKLVNSKGVQVCVDPKKLNFDRYDNVFLFKPNQREFSDYIGRELSDDELEVAVKNFQNKHHIENVLLTRGAKGVVMFSEYGNKVKYIPSNERQVADVTGAGDTVISIMSVCLISGMSVENSASIANAAGGFVCGKPGVAFISRDELLQFAKKESGFCNIF